MQCNVGTVFSHELCTFPLRLFATEELLLAADTKSELAKSIPSLEDPASSNRDDMKYVIDGGMAGMLIHRITWKVGSSFTDICASYVYFLSKYPQCTVVFDGNRNSTKDMAHKVRSKNLSCSNITVELSTRLTVKKAQFLSNPGNKQRFIDLLSELEYLIRSGFSCLNAQSDADVLICRTAVTLLQTKCNVTVVGDDTDLLVILIDMTRNLSLNRWKILLSTKTNIYDLKSVITSLGVKGASSILLLYSFTGCDTVSRIFGVGQGRLLNIRGKLTESIIQTFYSHDSTKEEIKSAGEKIFFLLLNLSASDGNLDAARLWLFRLQCQGYQRVCSNRQHITTTNISSCL